MKKKFLFTFLLMIFCFPLIYFHHPSEAEAASTVPVYRLYMPTNGEHLYTTDAHEKDVLYSQHKWGYEGIAWYTSTTGTPVYRLYNPGLRNHLYTTDRNEVETLCRYHGWQKDNGGNPVFYSSGSVPIYRVYNRKLSGMHHLTTDVNEYNTLPRHGWTQEGVKLYGIQKGNPIQTEYVPSEMAKMSYKKLIQSKSKVYGYYLHDLNSDGISELILKLGTCEADFRGEVYSYNKNTKQSFYAGAISMSHQTLYYPSNRNLYTSGNLWSQFFQTGGLQLNNISFNGSTVSESVIEGFRLIINLPNSEFHKLRTRYQGREVPFYRANDLRVLNY